MRAKERWSAMEYSIDERGIQLMKVEYDAFVEDGPEEPGLDVTGHVEILAEEDDLRHVVWDLLLDARPLMRMRAVYMSVVYAEGDGSPDLGELIEETCYPVLGEFSQLVGTLSRSITGTPLILNQEQLMYLAWGIVDDEEDEEPF